MADGQELLAAAREGLERSGEREVEVYARRARRGIARFANNVVGQHVDIAEIEVSARVAKGGRIALASGTALDADGIAKVIRSAAELAKFVPPLEAFPGFAPAAPLEVVPPAPSRATVAATAAVRAELLAPELRRAAEKKLVLSGTLETQVFEAAVVTTAGQAVASGGAFASARIFALAEDGASGFGGAMHRDVDQLGVGALAQHAIARCEAAREPEAVKPGEWDVVLEPPAVAELMEWLCFTGFGAREVEQGRSFLAGRAGERITGEAISFVDDPIAITRSGLGVPFDREGTPVKKVVLIENGVARGPVYDRVHAARGETESTGHAGIVEGELAPVAKSVHLAAGTESDESLLAGVSRGLLVSRFHYVNGLIDPRRAVMTGMTRDGTYLVEDGKPVRAVKNMRFTDAILEALARADGIGARAVPVPTWWSDGGAMVTPALRIRGLRFTGTAES